MSFIRATTAIFFASVINAIAASKTPIQIAELKRAEPVNFEREILPFLSDNCLACHCQTTTKGGLNLESPELMMKGGENGPAIVPKKPDDSLALQAAAHLDDDLAMPPRDNKAKAKDLTPEQLGLLKLWIVQGAKFSPRTERPIHWQGLADNLRTIFAVAVTADGQFAACARANRLCVYHLPSGRCVMDEAAHRDQINALAFNPEGTLMASGGFRRVKLWRRSHDEKELSLANAGSCAAVSPDGKWLATGGDSGAVKLWTLPDGKLTKTLTSPPPDDNKSGAPEATDGKTARAAIVSLKFSPDNAKIACATGDKAILIWNSATGELLAKAKAPDSIAALAWLGDGAHLATAGADNNIHIWTDALAPFKELKGHTGAVTALQSLGPNKLVSGSADGLMRLWEIEKDQSVAQMNHGGAIAAVAVGPDGLRFASAGADNAVKLWSADGKQIAELRGNRYLREAAAAKDREVQVAAGNLAYRKELADAAAKQLDASKDRVKKSADAVAPKQQDLDAKKKALAEARDAKTAADQALATAEADAKKAGEAFEAAESASRQAGTAVDTLKASPPPPAPAPGSDEKAITEKAAAGKAARDKAGADASARAQDVVKAKADRDQKEAQRKQAADKIDPLEKKVAEAREAFEKAETARSAAGTEINLAKGEEQKMTTALGDAKAAIEGAEGERKKAGEVLQAAQKLASDAEAPVRAVAFSPDNLTVATAGDDHFIHTWSAENGAPFDVLKGHEAPVSALAFYPTGELVSCARDCSGIVWNLRPTWKLERAIGTGEAKSPLADRVNALAFSPDGKILATGGGEPSRGGEIKLWDVADGKLVRDLPNVHSDTVFGLEFSPDGKFLASGAADKMARVVDVATGKIVRSFEGHTHHVLAVSWSLDGRTIATAGADNIVKIWDFTTGERKKNIEGFDKEVTSVSFAGASADLVTSSGDNKVRLVNVTGAEVRTFPDVADFMQSAAVTADGKTVVAGGQDGVLRVWNEADGGKLATFPPEKN